MASSRGGSPPSLPRVGASDPERLVRVLRALLDLSAEARGDLGAQLVPVLNLGRRELELPYGVVVQTRDDRLAVLEIVGPDDVVRSGQECSIAETFCGTILESKRAVAFPEENVSGRAWPRDPALPLKSYLGVPLRVGGEVFGVLSFGSREPREPFSAPEREIVEVIGRHLEGVIGAHLETRRVVRAFHRIGSAPPDRFFGVLAEQASSLLEADYVVVCEVIESNGERRLRTQAYLAHGEIAAPFSYEVAGTPCERTLGDGLYHCPSGVQQAFPDDEDLVSLGAESYLGAAIRDEQGRVIGQVAVLYAKATAPSGRREQLIRWLAARAAPSLLRLRAERALDDQGRILDLAVRAGGIGIWSLDLENGQLFVEGFARSVLGLGELDDAAAAWRDAILPEDRPEVEAAIVRTAQQDEPSTELFEFRIARPDQSVRWVLLRGRAVRDGSGKAIRLLAAGLDITEQRRLDEDRRRMDAKVQQSQRLESLGVLAGGLAHDFNNLLMGVLGNAGLARRALQRGSVVDQKIGEIESAAQRAAELTNQMLAYAGRSRFTADSVDLNGLVEEMARLLRSVVSKNAALSLQLSTEALPIEADPSQIQQVVMNLITNASDALADQPGAVTVATGIDHFDRHFLNEVLPDDDLLEGRYTYLDVVDTGIGMDEGTRGRIFDPFFTTKFSGRGLGLAAVLGIMRSHGGGVRVQSAPGEGTRVTVLFPAAVADESMLEEPDNESDAWEGQGAVLVVDDEEMVRNLMATVLEDVGFEVLTAGDGLEALQVFDENQDRIRLILLDMMMPRMNGEEVYTEIRAKRPDTSIILMSGFSEEHVTRSIPGEDAKFLKKPFEIGALLDTVHDVLDS